MRIVTWTVRLLIFAIVAAFAAKNIEPVKLRFYFDFLWEAPLVVVLLAFLALGAVLGLTAAVGTMLRQRREIGRLRRELRAQADTAADGGRGGSRYPPAVDG
jgi:lipopolysaccharide assembly protein A